jgi:glycosyltransferase involved in cell wall biosynthesis
MKILTHVISLERLGGLEVNTLEATKALAARGHDVHVLYGAPLLGTSGPETRAEFEAAGATLHGPYPFASTLQNAWAAIPGFIPAARFAARLRADVLWLQRPEQIIWGQTVSRLSGTPLVSHLHHVPNYGRALKPLNRGVAHFIAVSHFMRARWSASGIDERRIDVVYNAVPAAAYPPGGERERDLARQALGLPAGVPIALYYGRLEEAKGLGVTLAAWQRLAPKMGEAHLVFAGDYAPSGQAWRARTAHVAATGTVTVLPNQGNVVPLLHAADVVLFPSLLEESFGRVVLEALMTRRPVLASDIGAVPEILTGPLDRLLVPPGDATALADGIAGLLNWRQTEPELGSLCGAEAQARFSFDGYIDSLEESLSRCLPSDEEARRSGRFA